MTVIAKPSAKLYHIQIGLAAIVLIAILIITGGFLGNTMIILIGIIIFLALIATVVSTITIKVRTVEIGEYAVTVKTGLLNTRTIMIPYERMTNVNIKRGIFDRLMGMGTLEIDTAGTAQTEVIMPYMLNKDLEHIMSELSTKAKGKVVK